MGLIAIEEHWTAPELTAALKALPSAERDDSLAFNELGDKLARLEDIGDGRIAVMDSQGIDLSVLSLAPPATGPLRPAVAEPRAVAAELERATGLGAVGAMVYGRTGDTPLDDPRYDELFAVAAASGLPIFIHPQIPPSAVRSASYSGLGAITDLALATFAWGWHLEAGLAALRLIARGADEVKVSRPSAGGSVSACGG